MMESKDGTIIEDFEWKSRSSIEQAHTNPAVLQMWQQYSEVCEYIPIGKVEESANLFSDFTPFEGRIKSKFEGSQRTCLHGRQAQSIHKEHEEC